MKSILLYFILSGSCVFAQDFMWNQKGNMPAEGRHRTTGWSIGNKGYIGLGHYNSGFLGNVAKADIWEYNPAVDSWTQKADYAGGPTYGASAFTIGTKAYVGAHVYNGSEFYEFDPIANTWTAIPPMPTGSSDDNAFTCNGKGYYCEGNFLYEYDPQTQVWTPKTPCPVWVSSWSKNFVIDDKAYVLTQSSLYEYKPSTDEWLYRSNFPGEAVGGWATFSINGMGYVATGYIQFLNPTSRQTWQYDPNTNTWLQLQDLPGSSRRFSSFFSIGNKGYIGTGTNGTNLNDFWEFDATLAIPNTEEEVAVNTFPNPSRGDINVQVDAPNGSQYELEVYNLNGQLIYSEKNSQNTVLDRNKFEAGTYIYYIKLDNKVKSRGKITFI